jgi:O-antigen/teichoic acid export membrane protein
LAIKDLKGKAVRGGLVTIFGQAVRVVIRMGSLALLARLLVPEDFGLVGMVTAVTGIFEIVKDAGLSTATVQRATITDDQLSTLFWINMLVGGILWLLTIALAPVLTFFYREPRLLWVTVAQSFGFLFNAAGVQHWALLQRQMRFTALAVTEILSLVVSNAIGVGMAIGGCGYWALVVTSVSMPAVSTVCLWLETQWIPEKAHRNTGIRSMLRFGGTLTVSSLVVYFAYNAEKVLLGRFWGAEALGLYGRAYQLIGFPSGMLNTAVGTVAFPALSRLRGDPKRFKNYFLKGYSLVLGLTVPVTIACALLADDLIFRLLAPTTLVLAMINPLGWFLFSLGMVGRSLKVALVLAPLVISSYVAGLPYGPRGVAFAYSTMMCLWLVPHIAWGVHGTVISLQDLFRSASRPFFSGIAAAALCYGLQFYFGKGLSPLPRLILGGAVLVGTYLWILMYAMGQKAIYMDILQRLRSRSSDDEKEHAREAGAI